MEKSVSTKENRIGTHISNSSTSLLKIDSISIDLVNGNENEDVGNCQHFSIRGYVGEIRKSDRKQCWPFSMDDKHNCSEVNGTCTLPPIPAAKFRWWRCQNCLRETDPQYTPKEIETVLKFSQNNSACSHMSSHNEAAILPLDCEKPVKLKIVVGRKVNTKSFVNTNSDDFGSPCTSKRDKGVEVTNTRGRVIHSKEDMNPKIPKHTNSTTNFGPCSKFEKNKDDNRVALESKCNGLAETCKPNNELKKAAANGLADTNLNSKMRKYISEDDQSTKLMPAGEISSESDEIIGEKNLLAKCQDQSTFRRAKPRKIRLLSDILLASSGNACVDNSKSDDTPSTSSSQTKKRKTPSDGVVRSTMLNKKTKKTSNADRFSSLLPLQEVLPRGDEKGIQNINKSNTSDTSGSEHQSSMGKAIDSVVQSVLSAKETERKSSLGNEKTRKPQPKNLQAFLMPWNKELLRENLSTRHNVEPVHTVEKMLDFRQENSQNCTPDIEPRADFLLTGKEGIFKDDHITRKDLGCNYVGESSKPAANAHIDTELRWDLNIHAGPNLASLVREKQNRSPHFEVGDLSTLLKRDAFGKSNGDKSIKVKEHSKFVENQSVQNGDKVFDKGVIDDIPIEIIELLANERRLKNAEKVFPILETANKPQNGKRIDVKNVHADGKLKLLPEQNPTLLKSQSSDVGKHMFINSPITVGAVVNFPHTNIPSGFQAFSRCQQKVPNVVQPNGVWTSMIQNQMSREHQASSTDKLSRRPETLPNGRNGISNMKPLNLNVASYEKQNVNITSDSIKETRGKHPVACNKSIECDQQMARSGSMNSTEIIPALHLLSLMDSGIHSVTPFKVNEKTKILQKSPFPHDTPFKAGTLPRDPARHASIVNFRKTPLPEKSCECLSAVPAFGALTSSIQNDISIRRITDFLGQAPIKSRGGKGKAKRSYSPTLNQVPKSQKSVTNCEFSRDQSTEKKNLLGASFSIVCPSQHRKVEDSMKCIEFKAPPSYENGTIRPVKRKPEIEICILNRNPADFSIPGAGNKYMISADCFKFGRKVCPEKISALPSMDRPKKKRLLKRDALIEHAQNQNH